MSILIKEMHKPKSCEECPFKDYEQGFCFASADENGDFILCTGGVGKNEIHPDCPLVEIPKHGRLIDADELFEEYCEIAIAPYIYAPTIIEGEEE